MAQLCYKSREMTHQGGHKTEVEGVVAPTAFQDEGLVARAQEGEQWAFEELVSRYQQKAYAIAYHMCCGDSEEAKDLTQESFLRAFRNLRNFRRDSSFYTWFYRIVVNTCLDGKRRHRRWERIFSSRRPTKEGDEPLLEMTEERPEPGEDTNPMAVLSGKQLSGEIRKALMSLPERQRVAFQLKVFQGMSIREIAQVLGAAEGTVKSHLFRATHSLQEALKDWI